MVFCCAGLMETQRHADFLQNLRRALQEGSYPHMRSQKERDLCLKRMDTICRASSGRACCAQQMGFLLSFGALKGRCGLVQELLEAGGDKENVTEGYTPLFCAAINQHMGVIRVLVNAGASVDGVSHGVAELPTSPRIFPNPAHFAGLTPLMAATFIGRFEAAEFLVKAGADTEKVDSGGRNPMYFAALSGNPAIVRILLEAGAKPNGIVNGVNPLELAAGKGYLEAVRLLVSAGATRNLPAGDMADFLSTGLLTAASWDQLPVVQFMLEAGASVAHVTALGMTPLMVACEKGNSAVIQCLVEAGSNPSAFNAEGATPLSLAAHSGCCGVKVCFIVQ